MCAVPERPVTARFSWRQSVKPCGYARANPARRQPEMSLRSCYMHQDKKRTYGDGVMRGLGAALSKVSWLTRGFLVALAALAPTLASAQDAAEAAPVPNKGDTTWMMVATILVIIMAVPGLALFYGGMVRAKNMLSTAMQV